MFTLLQAHGQKIQHLLAWQGPNQQQQQILVRRRH